MCAWGCDREVAYSPPAASELGFGSFRIDLLLGRNCLMGNGLHTGVMDMLRTR